MNLNSLTYAFLATAAIGCASNSDESIAQCDQCDIAAPVAIAVGSPATCEVVSGDAADSIECQLNELPENSSITIGSLAASVTYKDGTNVVLDGGQIRSAPIPQDQYPAELRIEVTFADPSHEPDPNLPQAQMWDGQSLSFSTELSQGTGSVAIADLPFDLWEVVFWPSDELVREWESDDNQGVRFTESMTHTIPSQSWEFSCSVPRCESDNALRFNRVRKHDDEPSLAPMRDELRHIVVPKGDFSASLKMEIYEFKLGAHENTAPIDGPGYYMLSSNPKAEPMQAP